MLCITCENVFLYWLQVGRVDYELSFLLVWVCYVQRCPEFNSLIEFYHPVQHYECHARMFIFLFEPPQDKTNKKTCVPSEDSDQPEHPLSLNRIFAVCAKDSQGHKASLCGQWRLIRLCLGHRSFCWFFHAVAHLSSVHVQRPDSCYM